MTWLDGTSKRSTYFPKMSASRLTASPGSSPPRLVTSRVWGMIDTEKVASSTSRVTVRLTPLTAIDPFSIT